MAELATMAEVITMRNSQALSGIRQERLERARNDASPKAIPYQQADRLNAAKVL